MNWKNKLTTAASGDKVRGKPKNARTYTGYSSRHPINTGEQFILDKKQEYDTNNNGYWYTIKNNTDYRILDKDCELI